MPSVLKENGVILLPQVAKRVAIEYRAAIRAVGDPGEKILQGAGISDPRGWKSSRNITTAEGEYTPASGMVAQVRPEEESFRTKLKGMFPAQKGDVIHNVIIFARAIVFGQILIAP